MIVATAHQPRGGRRRVLRLPLVRADDHETPVMRYLAEHAAWRSKNEAPHSMKNAG